MKQSVESLAVDVLRAIPKTVLDDCLYIASIWAAEDGHVIGSQDFKRVQQTAYRFLLNHTSSETACRIKREVILKRPTIKHSGESTEEERTLFKGLSVPLGENNA